MESVQAHDDVIEMEMPDEEASMSEAEIKQELMELEVIIQSSESCRDTKRYLVEIKLENASPEQEILESEDNITDNSHVVDQSGADSSNKTLKPIIESNSGNHEQLLGIKKNPVTPGDEFVLNGSTESLNGLKVLSEELNQENNCTKSKNLPIEDDVSIPEVKCENIQDYLDIGETVITSSVEIIPEKKNSAAKPNPVTPCSETIEVVPCAGLKCPVAVLRLLQSRRVRKLSAFEKAYLINTPRPTPNLEILGKRRNKKFNRSIYENNWIAGCSHVNKFFCWYCILFCSSVNNNWTKGGFHDLVNLSYALKRHQTSHKHLNAVISFHSYGKQQSLPTISRQISDEINRYNANVDYNRSVFKRLVDVVCHLAKLDLPFKSQDESETSLNKGNFSELVTLLSKYDYVLGKQMQETRTSYLTNKILNDIICSVSDVAKARIKAEIRQSQFMSVIVDETPVANNRDQLFLIFRYFFDNNINERFMGFINFQKCTVDELFQFVLDMIKKYECEKKLIAQSYDGTSITAAVKNGIQSKVKEVIPQAINVWCDPHTFNMVLSKSCSRIGDVNSFFFSLFGLANFFSNNEKILLYCDMFCTERLPDITPANRWSYLSCIVSTAYEQKKNLRNLFTEITDTPEIWDADTNLSADNLLNLVESFKFHFYLEVFQAIFKKTDSINCVEQKSQADLLHLTPKIDELKDWLCNFKSHFSILYENALQDNSPPPSSRVFPCARARYNQIFVQIIENISTEINDRLEDIINLRFLRLLNESCFDRYAIVFPEKEFDTLRKNFRNHFDAEVLKNQLMCIYSAEEVQGFNLFRLIDFIDKFSLKNDFSELSKLIHLMATVPATVLDKSQFSNLNKRVHAHLALKNAQREDSFADLATIAIEKELLLNLRCSKTFYDDVINSFSSKDPSFDLEYK